MTIQTPLDSFQTRIGKEGGDPGLRRPRKRTLALPAWPLPCLPV